ncbi:MAG TPA: polyphosphate kinase 2 family protein [Candidatus Tyrphobacter sp.]
MTHSPEKICNKLVVEPASRLDLARRDPSDRLGFAGKRDAELRLAEDIAAMAALQDVFAAVATHALLIVLQGIDAAGKDGVIKHVMTGVNPQGISVHAFKEPTSLEARHDYLWRAQNALPERGRIGIFNRSHYEDVLVTRVHPELLEEFRGEAERQGHAFWRERFEDIAAFERHLTRNGTVVLKFFLHVGKDEQRKRFLKRLEDPNKQWKFSASDLQQRAYWKQYMTAYEDALSATSTACAPWYVVPADHKWVSRLVVATIVVAALRRLHLTYPVPAPQMRALLETAKQQLDA